MLNPILHELVARERFKDNVREVEQHELANAAIAPGSALHAVRPTSSINIAVAAGRLFRALMCAGQGWINLLFHHNDVPCG